MLWQPALPDRYIQASPAELAERIAARRKQLGQSLIILGHHYQADDVIQHADLTGDSLKLSQLAAQQVASSGAKYVVFCGVHFMAETADMLTPEDVAVILPDLSAGCSMADMADYEDAVLAWNNLHAELARQGFTGRVIPVTYINSTAAIKAFVGQRGGAVCTSSNAQFVLEWALAGGDQPRAKNEEVKVLFLPDQHLGRNTAARLGLNTDTQTAVYDPRATARGEALGGMTAAQLKASTVLLWAGHCSVHKLFRPEHINAIRDTEAHLPPAERTKVLVHPECTKEVVDLADLAGSTEFIIKTINAAAPGSKWAIGTEVHLVSRLARDAARRGVHARILSDCQCLCTTMYRIDQAHLLWVLDNLAGDTGKPVSAPAAAPSALSTAPGTPRIVNQITVHPEARTWALLALERMLKLSLPIEKLTRPAQGGRPTASAIVAPDVLPIGAQD